MTTTTPERDRRDAPDWEPTNTDAFSGEARDRLREGRDRQLRDLADQERPGQRETDDNEDANTSDETPDPAAPRQPGGQPQPIVTTPEDDPEPQPERAG